jgi:hypothetical protein
MKFKKIVGFGDSYMWGDELLDPALIDHPDAHPVLMQNTCYRESNCFLGRLGSHYGLPTENFGWPGGSLQSTIWTYLWWIEHESVPLDQCLVLIALTDANRHSFYEVDHVAYANDPPWNRFVHSSWVHSGKATIQASWEDMVKKHMTLTDCLALWQLNYRQAVLFFHGQRENHAGLLQFNTLEPVTVVNKSTVLWPDQNLRSQLNSLPDHQHLLAPMGHPNILGHEWVASRLIPEIDHVTMIE